MMSMAAKWAEFAIRLKSRNSRFLRGARAERNKNIAQTT